jgi:Niemann-Pick C1 N terminus
VNNTEAQPVLPAVAKKLQDVCPQLYKESGEQNGKYCCTEQQIDQLTKQVINQWFASLRTLCILNAQIVELAIW